MFINNAEESEIRTGGEVRDLLAIAQALAYRLQQFSLVVFLKQDVLVGPGIAISERLTPGGVGDDLRNLHTRNLLINRRPLQAIPT